MMQRNKTNRSREIHLSRCELWSLSIDTLATIDVVNIDKTYIYQYMILSYNISYIKTTAFSLSRNLLVSIAIQVVNVHNLCKACTN